MSYYKQGIDAGAGNAYKVGLIDNRNIVGEEEGGTTPASELPQYKELNKLIPAPTVNQGIKLLEHAYGVLEVGMTKGAGGWFQKNLGVEETVANLMKKVATKAEDFRAMAKAGKGEDMLLPTQWGPARDMFFASLNQYAAINEGRHFQDSVFDQFVADVVKGLQKKMEQGKKSIGTGVLIGGGALAILLAFKVMK